jgi:predicted methyltransferase
MMVRERRGEPARGPAIACLALVLVACGSLAHVAAGQGAMPGDRQRPQQRPLQQQQPPAQSPHGKLFAPVDLGLLEAPDRDAWQKPDQVMRALGIADGSVVGDLGAAGGWFTVRLARFVGPSGLIYAEDVQRQTYHEMEDPVTLLRNAARALKPQGRMGIIDYKKDGLGPGPPLEDRVEPDTIVRDANAAGLRLLKRENFLPFQFFLIFGK